MKEILDIVKKTIALYPNLTFCQILTMLGLDPQNQAHYSNETILKSVKSMYNFLKNKQNGN
jgi:hypothetical protein